MRFLGLVWCRNTPDDVNPRAFSATTSQRFFNKVLTAQSECPLGGSAVPGSDVRIDGEVHPPKKEPSINRAVVTVNKVWTRRRRRSWSLEV